MAKVFGDQALVQRCTLHKRRNVGDHLPQDQRGWVDHRLARAFNHPDPDAGMRQARDLARQLEARWPDAAAGLREGLDDMFTVRRLGVGDRLARSLTNTNMIESMISVGRTNHPQRQAVEGRDHRQALGCGRDAQRRAQLPTPEGLQGHAHARGRHCPSRRSCHTHLRQ